MRRAWGIIASAAAIAVAAIAVVTMREAFQSSPALEIVDLSARRSTGAPALCPWREPSADMQVFFPGATHFTTETVVFSSLRPQIMARLGKNVPLRETTLQEFHVFKNTKPVGTVMVRATAGQHGAIEVVVAAGLEGRTVGVRLQRLREPPEIASVLTSPAWLQAFQNKTARDAWRVGGDIPAVPPVAGASAAAIVGAVRTLLIEQDVAAQATAKAK